MEKDKYGIITFKSTHYAIQGEEVLRERQIPFKTIPTPREITLSCGLSIRFSVEDMDEIERIIENGELAINNVYKYIKDNSNYYLEKII